MKKIISLLCSAAIVALSLAGCSKNETPEQGDQAVGVERVVTFSANTPSTKSYFGDKTSSGYPTVWTNNTKVGISVNYNTPTDAVVTPVGTGNKATFDATVKQPASGSEFTFYAVSPSSVAVSANSTYSSFLLDIPSSQSPTKGSVDEAAHIMFAQSATLTTWPAEGTTVNLDFSHIAAYGKFTLENFREDGKSGKVRVNSVTIESDSVIVGRFYYYPATKHYSPNPAAKVLTINTENIEYTHNNSDLTIWFAIRPVDLKGSNMKITLNTTDGTFEKTFQFPTDKGTFKAGKVGTFVIDMDGIGPKQDEVYTLVTDYNVLREDAKVIIASVDDAKAISTTQQNNNRSETGVTKTTESNVSVIKNPSSDVQIFVLESGLSTLPNTVSFKCENGTQANLYIGASSADGNHLRSYAGNSDELAAGNCSFDVDLVHENLSDGNLDYALLTAKSSTAQNYMRYNAGSSCFSLYKENSSVAGKVALYVLNGSGTGEPLINKDPKVATPEISFNSSTNEVTITCATAGALIGYTDDGTDPQADNSGPIGTTKAYTGPFTISQTTTIKAFAGGLSGYENSDIATKECVVSGSYDFETIAKINELAEAAGTTETEYSGKLTGVTVTFVPDAKNAFIKDASGSTLVFINGHGLKQGQTFTGDVTIKVQAYNKLNEVTAINASFTGTGAVVNPTVVTLAQIVGNYTTYQSEYVKLENVDVTAVNNKNITVSDGTRTYIVYTNYGNSTAAVGDKVTAIGTITRFNTTEELKVWTASDISISHTATTHKINFTQPSEGGSFTVKVDGSAIASGADVDEGKTVTLEATPASGFNFNAWTITGATPASATSASTTFTVGTSDVTISAEFVSSSLLVLTMTMQEYATTQSCTISSGSNVTCYPTLTLNSHVTMSTSGSANCGSFWGTSNTDWRLYQNKKGDVTISVSAGHTLKSVKFTYNVTNTGTLKDGDTVIASGTKVSLSGTSKTFTVGNTSNSVTNGQVRITAVQVEYE